MRALIRRLFPMHHDVVPRWRSRHRGRPALVARRAEHHGATADSPLLAELPLRDPEPEETEAEAAERQARELARHRAELERLTDGDVAELERIDGVLEPLRTAVDDACRVVLRELGLSDNEADQLLARYASAAEPTGGWPTVVVHRIPDPVGWPYETRQEVSA